MMKILYSSPKGTVKARLNEIYREFMAMDDNLMELMSADDLIQYIHNYLNHHSSVALGFATLLTEERYLELANEKQKKIMLSLRNEIERIREINEQMAQWVMHHHGDRVNYPGEGNTYNG